MRMMAVVCLLAMMALAAQISADEGKTSGVADASAVEPEAGAAAGPQRAGRRTETVDETGKTPAGRTRGADQQRGVSFKYDALGRVIVIERGEGSPR